MLLNQGFNGQILREVIIPEWMNDLARKSNWQEHVLQMCSFPASASLPAGLFANCEQEFQIARFPQRGQNSFVFPPFNATSARSTTFTSRQKKWVVGEFPFGFYLLFFICNYPPWLCIAVAKTQKQHPPMMLTMLHDQFTCPVIKNEAASHHLPLHRIGVCMRSKFMRMVIYHESWFMMLLRRIFMFMKIKIMMKVISVRFPWWTNWPYQFLIGSQMSTSFNCKVASIK